MQQRIKQLQEEKRQLEAQAAAERLRSNPFSPDYTPNHGQTYQRDPNLPPATLLPDNNDRVQNVSPFGPSGQEAERLRSNPFSPYYTPNHGQTYQRDPNLPPATLLPDNNDRVQNVSPFDARPTPFANKPRSPFPPGPPLKVPY